MKTHLAKHFAFLIGTAMPSGCDDSADSADFGGPRDPEEEEEEEIHRSCGPANELEAECIENWTGGVILRGEFGDDGRISVSVVDLDSGMPYCEDLERGQCCNLRVGAGVNELQIKGDEDVSRFVYYTTTANGLSQIYWERRSPPTSPDEKVVFDFTAVGTNSEGATLVEGDPTIQLLSTASCPPPPS